MRFSHKWRRIDNGLSLRMNCPSMVQRMSAHDTRFREANPGLFYLNAENPGSIEVYLRSRGVLREDQSITTAARAGEGNMNCTVRVSTDSGSLIVKQARPWVEKYPQFAAPWDRACREAEFYHRIAAQPRVAAFMPRLLDFDPVARVLILEDLGVASDYSSVYRGESFTPAEISAMGDFLSGLHRGFSAGSATSPLANREMRELNHRHIFAIPLASNNGLDLDAITPGLAAGAQLLQSDSGYGREVARLGRHIYLSDGPCLLHGDFFPGSLLRTASGPRVIDPEFGHFGRPEFDVGVFLAHLLLANQSMERVTQWRHAYAPPDEFDNDLMLQLAGVEIMRRLIGYAQLPVGYGLSRKRELLELSRTLVLQPQMESLAGSQ